MNKQTFIEELKKGLAARGVADVGDIVSDYEEHFARKLADGYTEQETAKKLGDPRALALEFAPEGEAPRRRAGFLRALGVILTDLVTVPFFILAFAWAAGIAAATLGCVFAGLCLIASPAFPAGTLVIPYLPYVPGAAAGVALLALGALFLVLAAYSFLLAAKTMKAYFRWHRRVLSGRKTPPYAIFPLAGNRGRRAWRSLAIAGLAVFAPMVTAAYAIMTVLAGSLEFWHVWGWFGYVK